MNTIFLMKTVNEIKALVGENRVEEALNALLLMIEEKDDTLVNQIILTKGRFKEYVTNTTLGLSERDHERQQIINSVLILADDAEEFIKAIDSTSATPAVESFDITIKGNDEIIGILFMHMYAYTVNDFKFLQPTLHTGFAEVKIPEWKEFLKKNAAPDTVFQIIKIEPITEDATKATYKMDYIRKNSITPPAFPAEWTSDVFTLMPDDKKRWKIVNDENIEFKIIGH